jgi:hypothetical protein
VGGATGVGAVAGPGVLRDWNALSCSSEASRVGVFSFLRRESSDDTNSVSLGSSSDSMRSMASPLKNTVRRRCWDGWPWRRNVNT